MAKQINKDDEKLKEKARLIRNQIKQIKINIEILTNKKLEERNPPHPTTPLNGNQIILQKDNLITGVKPYIEWDLIDFEKGIKLHGNRGYILKKDALKIKRKLLDKALEYYELNGFEEVGVPYLVNGDIAIATGHLPKFDNEMFKTIDGQYLIPTGELPLIGMYANEVLTNDKYLMTYTACFRNEKIAYGKENKGLKRLHQFDKLELCILTTAEKGEQNHEKLLKMIANFIDQLGLTYRVLLLGTDDLGFAAAKTYDIEVWLPFQNEWMEVASISNCTDFQARRANIKYDREYAHTLNGTGIAMERILIALMETYNNINEILLKLEGE